MEHTNPQHANRVRQELDAAGISKYGLLRAESRYLPLLVHPDEHIIGAVFGRISDGAAMLVATDRRVIFLDRRPLFTTNDELPYQSVSGIKHFNAGLFATVVLHTRMGDYTLRYVNKVAALKFVECIEQKRIEEHTNGSSIPASPAPVAAPAKVRGLTTEAKAFLKSQDTAVFSTVDRTGNVTGATVYYCLGSDYQMYIVTHPDTRKARNILTHAQVALTITRPEAAQTVQLQGFASAEQDQATQESVLRQLMKPRAYNDKAQPPPVTQLPDHPYIVLRITPTQVEYHNYA